MIFSISSCILVFSSSSPCSSKFNLCIFERFSIFFSLKGATFSVSDPENNSLSVGVSGDDSSGFIVEDNSILKYVGGVNFEKDNGILKDAFYVCSGCGSPWSDSKRLQAVNNGTWKPSAEFSNIRSFNISALYSPWTSIFEQAVYFHQVKDYPEKLKVFVNTVLCQLWDDDAGESIDGDKLKARSEDFGDKLPTDVVLLTA